MSGTPKKSTKPTAATPMRITRATSKLAALQLDAPEAEVKDSPPEEVDNEDNEAEVQAGRATPLEPEAAALAAKNECPECQELQRQLDYYKATSEQQKYELARQQNRVTALLSKNGFLENKILELQDEVRALEKKLAAHETLPMATQDFLAALEYQKGRNAGIQAAAKPVLAALQSHYREASIEDESVFEFENDLSDLVNETFWRNRDLAELIKLLKRVVPRSGPRPPPSPSSLSRFV